MCLILLLDPCLHVMSVPPWQTPRACNMAALSRHRRTAVHQRVSLRVPGTDEIPSNFRLQPSKCLPRQRNHQLDRPCQTSGALLVVELFGAAFPSVKMTIWQDSVSRRPISQLAPEGHP